MTLLRTEGLDSRAAGKQGAGARDCWLRWHQASVPRISLGLGEQQSWPPSPAVPRAPDKLFPPEPPPPPPSHVLQCWSAFAYFSFTLNPLQTDFPVQCLQGCAEIRLPHNRVHWTPCHPLPIGSQWPPTLWVTPSLEGTCHLAFLTPPLLGFSYLSDFSTNLHMEEFFGAQIWVVFSLHWWCPLRHRSF